MCQCTMKTKAMLKTFNGKHVKLLNESDSSSEIENMLLKSINTVRYVANNWRFFIERIGAGAREQTLLFMQPIIFKMIYRKLEKRIVSVQF